MRRHLSQALLVALVFGCGVEEPTDSEQCRGKCDEKNAAKGGPMKLRCHSKGYYREGTTFNTETPFGSSPPSPHIFQLEIDREPEVALLWELRVVNPAENVEAYPANAKIIVRGPDKNRVASAELEHIDVEVDENAPGADPPGRSGPSLRASAEAKLELPFDAVPGTHEIELHANPTHPKTDEIRQSAQSWLAAKCTDPD